MVGKRIQPHVILVPYPSQGHINPLLQFAKRLASKGVKSTIATTKYTVNSIYSPNISVESISDGFDEGGFTQAQNTDVFLKSFRENGSRTLSQILTNYENSTHPISCIVYDSFLPWALDVAKKHGIYGASFFTNSATVCAVFAHIHHGTFSLPVKIEENEPLLLPGLPCLYPIDVPGFIREPESYPAYLAMKMSQFSNLKMLIGFLTILFKSLKERYIARGISKFWPAKLIGPMVPSLYLDGRIENDKGYGASLWKPLSEECLNWLKTKPKQSVIYISFGSMVSLTPKQMKEIAYALIGINMNFLWVVRDTEKCKLPKGFIESTKGKGLIVSWCNQLETLANQAIGCFVTHCGWNSTLEGLSLGVPMVAMPQWSDQMTDAKFIDEIWEIGVRPKLDELLGIVKREELLFCLKEVMKGEKSYEIRRNATKLRNLAKKTVSEGGSSDKTINEFVYSLNLAC
ncbi:hypothetical protein H5410_025873 [Solanum commersonii]|uniref:Glycosyltransferase n=1 Tax=Solanum commersonii TaxID=4109 RepID=A0A9J5YX34_SOLCO|nr:hypothetical protein H5410_025873 [Solanum commersonii]